MKNCQLTIPSVVFAGQGSVEKLSTIIERESAKHVLIFTDKGIRGLGLSKPAEEICGKYADVTVIEDLTAEPAVSDIERVLAEVKSQPEQLLELWLDYRKDFVLWGRSEKGLPGLIYRTLTVGVNDVSPGALRVDPGGNRGEQAVCAHIDACDMRAVFLQDTQPTDGDD